MITTPEQMREAANNDEDLIRRIDAITVAHQYTTSLDDPRMFAEMRAIPIATQPVAVTVKPLVWTGGAILVATGPDIQTIGHSIPSDSQVEYDTERAARILSALTIHPSDPLSDPLSDPRVKALVEAARALRHSVCGPTGFADAVRHNSGQAYPWPSLDAAELALDAALRAIGGEA